MANKDFWREQAEWSEKTFGSDVERGPKGPLLHLQKEVKEALDELEKTASGFEEAEEQWQKFFEEMVDCQFLVFDAARRAGLSYDEFLTLCFKKLDINKKRKWQKPSTDAPVEHER